MKSTTLIAVTLILSACATAEPQDDKGAIGDFVNVRGLQSVDRIRADSKDDYHELSEYYVIYRTRNGDYLFEFARRCRELKLQSVKPDRRWDLNTIRAGSDTLRGCRIDKIYGLTETDMEELRQLGGAPGSQT